MALTTTHKIVLFVTSFEFQHVKGQMLFLFDGNSGVFQLILKVLFGDTFDNIESSINL